MKFPTPRSLLCAALGAAVILAPVFVGCVSHHENGEAENKKDPNVKSEPTKGDKFLAENQTKEGVKTTPSGLQYKVLKEGSGKSPGPTDTVVCQYRGTLIDGTEFDSSYKRGEPAEFPLNRVIPGWTEGVQLMKEGSKYQFFIPSNLAYGMRGSGNQIGPYETLIFEIELIKVK